VFSWLSKKENKIGLALGGGAARGLAHVGILKALEKHDIPISYITGTSVGALFGGLYAAGVPTEEIVSLAKNASWKKLTGISLNPKGFVSLKPMYSMIYKEMGNITFKELKIPFAVVATDVFSGKAKLFNEADMKVALAIEASVDFPGFFAPVAIENRYYFDGGATCNLPIKEVKKMGADIIIGVDVIPEIELEKLPSNLALIADRALDLLLERSINDVQKLADIILKPVTKPISSFDLDKAKELIELGEKCVEKNLNKIKRAML
jgi:NTE family protein